MAEGLELESHHTAATGPPLAAAPAAGAVRPRMRVADHTIHAILSPAPSTLCMPSPAPPLSTFCMPGILSATPSALCRISCTAARWQASLCAGICLPTRLFRRACPKLCLPGCLRLRECVTAQPKAFAALLPRCPTVHEKQLLKKVHYKSSKSVTHKVYLLART